MSDITKLLDKAVRNWPTPRGLVPATLLVAATVTTIAAGLRIPPMAGALVLLALEVATFSAWMYVRRIPRARKGRLGFLLCLSIEGEDEQRKIKSDFIDELRRLLKQGRTGSTFDFLLAPEHIARKTEDQADIDKLLAKCRAHFGICGRVKLREVNGIRQHLIALDGTVRHRPIPEPAQTMFGLEFATLLPRRTRVPEKNDVLGLGVTSFLAACTAKYIIGMAAVFSGDLSYAERLFLDAAAAVSSSSVATPGLLLLRRALPIRLGEVYCAQANRAFFQWRRTRDGSLLEQVGLLLGRVPTEAAGIYRVRLLRSVETFLNRRDVEAALHLLGKCRNERDGTWLLSMGFLYAYKGRLDKATRCMKQSRSLHLHPQAILEAEEFSLWVLTQEPDKQQLHYLLGLLNWRAKGDLVLAAEHFESFLTADCSATYTEEKRLAAEWTRVLRSRAAKQATRR